VYSPTPTESAPTLSGAETQRNVRYSFLLGRLRNRQITMEEATELFGIMQAMLRMSEAARVAATRGSAAPSTPAPPTAPPRMRTAPAPTAASASDDLFLLGLITMGAGAGLMTAVARRLTEGPLPPTAAKRSGTGSTDPRR
jgi:hypothetical protein